MEPRGDGGEVEGKLLFSNSLTARVRFKAAALSETAWTIGEKPLTCCP